MIDERLNHVAIILDGNRRWAKEKGMPQMQGHKKGFDNIIDLVPYIINKGVKVLSVYAFSIENFKRTEEEVKYLMDIFAGEFKKRCKDLNKENIKVVFSGRTHMLRDDVQHAIKEVEESTKNNTKGIFNVCMAYGGQQEIVDAAKKIVIDVNEGKLDINALDEKLMYKYMYHELPPIDFLIRTSGEVRVSNYMMYNLSYAEMYFPNVYFPDFSREEFDKAVDVFYKRNRRFGGNDEKKTNS